MVYLGRLPYWTEYMDDAENGLRVISAVCSLPSRMKFRGILSPANLRSTISLMLTLSPSISTLPALSMDLPSILVRMSPSLRMPSTGPSL